MIKLFGKKTIPTEEQDEEIEKMYRYEYGKKDASHLLIQLIDEHNLLMMEKEIDAIQNEAGDDFHLIAFTVNDWNDDLSPWKAPAVFGDHAFAGGAEETLAWNPGNHFKEPELRTAKAFAWLLLKEHK